MNFIKSFSFESLKGILSSPIKNNHPKFHGHCKTENRPIQWENPQPDKQVIRFARNYFCLKHRVYCGPSFWEWGWFDGTDSLKMIVKPGPKAKKVYA